MSDFKSDVSSRSVRQVEEFADALAKNDAVQIAERIRALRLMARTLAEQVEELLPEPKPAHYLYKERPDKDMTPIDFVKKYYAKYLGSSLTMAHIKKFDTYLYSQLRKVHRSNANSEAEINLPSKTEFTASELLNFTDYQLGNLSRLGEFHTRHNKSG